MIYETIAEFPVEFLCFMNETLKNESIILITASLYPLFLIYCP